MCVLWASVWAPRPSKPCPASSLLPRSPAGEATRRKSIQPSMSFALTTKGPARSDHVVRARYSRPSSAPGPVQSKCPSAPLEGFTDRGSPTVMWPLASDRPRVPSLVEPLSRPAPKTPQPPRGRQSALMPLSCWKEAFANRHVPRTPFSQVRSR